ncbi:YolD-like family protein [Bacillus atrophaeus]|uniref:YolD-like family protein n=1 Tax=Bacillus atrophaeus TaxID=1452 RepID=UPI002282771A|nr:YolD-like family protein [Bacillus atrophaeus]MCY8824266.1 YolD-like family protein [Bacillus atrophaeus]MCY8840642.1 YolD-like family protein [Bacillus atrophaeus]MEC0804896.1 YolD-like family protein [Bacillus atrophaeus]MEC0852812.1 YolD-like family protein [Bacillus atrophaeus]MEC0855939.1 YolD-like family protein [Bacillus atrophaeus]
MLRDRGTIKWTSMTLPEHLPHLKQDLLDVSKIEKPSLDNQQIEEMDIFVSKAMSLNKELKFQLYEDGYVKELIGRVQYLNYEQKKLHVKDQNDLKIYITMNDIIGVAYND